MYIPVSITVAMMPLIVLATLATALAYVGGIWLWKHLRPEHRFRLSAIWFEYLSLLFFVVNGAVWVVFPQYFVDYLVEWAPTWIVLFLGTPVAHHFYDGQRPEPDAGKPSLPNEEQ